MSPSQPNQFGFFLLSKCGSNATIGKILTCRLLSEFAKTHSCDSNGLIDVFVKLSFNRVLSATVPRRRSTRHNEECGRELSHPLCKCPNQVCATDGFDRIEYDDHRLSAILDEILITFHENPLDSPKVTYDCFVADARACIGW